MEDKTIIYCDGGSRGNPGFAASAFVVRTGGLKTAEGSVFFERATNNFAEYYAVYLAIEWLSKNKKLFENQNPVIVNLDSQLVERQLNGFYRIKNQELKKIFDKIKYLISINKLLVKFIWNYRDKNKDADSLVNKTLDNNLRREN